MGSKNIIPMDRWPPLLPMYMAEHEASVGEPLYTLEEIAEHFDITTKDIDRYSEQIAFREEVRASIATIKDSNSVIRQKAKAQLETYLDTIIPIWMSSDEFPDKEKVNIFKHLSELAETGGSGAAKAQAKLDTLSEAKTPSLNIYITPAGGGEAQPVSGITITQEPEKLEESEEESKDGEK